MSDPEVLRSAIFEGINNQIRDGTPPETRETYHRLLSEGYSEEEVMQYIGAVVSSEMFAVLNDGRTYDNEGYVAALNALPRLPWEEEK
jgi:hypothetical protein